MKKLFLVLAALLVFAASGCAPKVDVEAERAALLQVDADWAKAAVAKDLERWLSFFADDAVMLPPNAPIMTGKDAIGKLWSEMFATPGFTLSLQPTKTEVSRAGDLAYILGTYKVTMNDPEGNPVTDRGKYVTVWKKQPDGTWKVVADIWNSDLPPLTTGQP